jgi:hypothetical protein
MCHRHDSPPLVKPVAAVIYLRDYEGASRGYCKMMPQEQPGKAYVADGRSEQYAHYPDVTCPEDDIQPAGPERSPILFFAVFEVFTH